MSSITIWSSENPARGVGLTELAREAETGDAICTRYVSEFIQEPGMHPNGGEDAVTFLNPDSDDEEEGDEDDLMTDDDSADDA